jgi:glucose-1-phosphate thymidylyltransferase
MKGIVLAGGTGSRLWPITRGVSKQLLPVYDKPLIHYPIGTLFLSGIRDILIITTHEDSDSFQRLLGDGSQYGVKFSFEVQANPNGLAEAFIIGEKFINGESVALVLGDNIFHGEGFHRQLREIDLISGAIIFAYEVSNPESYGVVEFDESGRAISIEEKPLKPKSNLAIPGLYFYDCHVTEFAKTIRPSLRGELEITTLNEIYMKSGKLKIKKVEKGTTWLDTGTFDSLHSASAYVRIIEERQGSKISCLEEIALKNNWISEGEFVILAETYKENPYGKYLLNLLRNGSSPSNSKN